jgi:hypothetical protein
MTAGERLRSERGAVFVQVGIAVFVLVAFNAFVLDYGMVWIARRQAQNAADSGALAGAVARGYDDFDPTPSPTGTAARMAKGVAAANLIWNQAGVAQVPSFDCPAGVAGRCVRVDVYRNGEACSAPLPTVFGPLLGVTSQGVRATATAVSGNGNATNCLRPFAFADDWIEHRTPNQFNRFSETGPSPGTLLSPHDDYATPGTTISGEFGQRIDFEFDRNPQLDPITHGFLLPIDLGGTYADNITACSGRTSAIGQVLPLANPAAGVTAAGVTAVIAQDPAANWNAGINKVENSCAPACGPVSPRLIPVALFDPAEYQLRRATNNWTACPGNVPCVTVVNIIAVFIHVGAAPNPHGHMVRYPGMTVTTAPTYSDDASWLATTSLIR